MPARLDADWFGTPLFPSYGVRAYIDVAWASN